MLYHITMINTPGCDSSDYNNPWSFLQIRTLSWALMYKAGGKLSVVWQLNKAAVAALASKQSILLSAHLILSWQFSKRARCLMCATRTTCLIPMLPVWCQWYLFDTNAQEEGDTRVRGFVFGNNCWIHRCSVKNGEKWNHKQY